jgi:cobalt/nickel transport system permease protein
VSGAHGHALYVHGHSVLHRAAPQVEILVAFLFVAAVVSTPREAFAAFGFYAAVLAALAAAAAIPLRYLAARMVILTPFVVLALLLPLFGSDPTTEVLGISLSIEGLWDMWNLLAKASLGLLTAVILGATTEIADLVRGLGALRVPRVVTAILGFMVRYADVVIEDVTRMRIALASRGHRTRTVADWRPFARATGTMFVRTYERGERVYLAMESRGYAGTMPPSPRSEATVAEWLVGAAIVCAAWLVALASWGLT